MVQYTALKVNPTNTRPVYNPPIPFTNSLVLVIVLLFISLKMFGGNNIIKLDSVQVPPGQTIEINIIINNDDPFISFQLDIPLPSGFIYINNSAQLNPQRATDHTITANVISGNVLRVVGFSFNNSHFIGNSGPVALFGLNTPTSPGSHELPILNYVIGNSTGQNICNGVEYGAVNLLGPLSVTVSADPDQVCAGEPVQLSSQISGGAWNPTLQWSSVPPGFASNDPSPLVFPSEDIQYILTVNDGNQVVSDDVNVSVGQPPTANAGSGFQVCIGDPVQLSGSATNYNSVLWEGGSGTFTSPNNLTTSYIPHPDDYINSPIQLTLTAFGSPLCPAAISSLALSFEEPAEATAGNDKFVHAGQAHQVEGATANNFESLLWTTTGDGTFDNSSILNPVYTHGVQDVINGSALLSLTAFPIGVCEPASDSKILYILSGDDNVMQLHGGTADINDTIAIRISISNRYDFTSFSCQIEIPDNMTYLNGTAVLTGREDDHQLTVIQEGDLLMLEVVSPTNAIFNGSYGNVVRFELSTGEDEGVFPIIFNEASILEPEDHFDILTATENGQITVIITSTPASNAEHDPIIQLIYNSSINSSALKINLKQQSSLYVQLYDLTGRLLSSYTTNFHSAGTYKLELNQIIEEGIRTKNGVYLLRVRIDDSVHTSASFKLVFY